VRSTAHIAAIAKEKPLALASLGLCACVIGLGAASGQEYCVACTEPTAVYRCVIENARPGGQSLTRLCLTALTKDGGHASCSLKGGTVFDCNGPIKRVPWTAQETGRVLDPAAADAAPSKPDAKADTKSEPKTMVDLAKRANENLQKAGEDAKQQSQSTGQAIGNATKKTWECMFSLFFRC